MRVNFSLVFFVILCSSGCSISSVDTSHSVEVTLPLSPRLSAISSDPLVYQVKGTPVPTYLTKIERCDDGARQRAGGSWRGLFAKFDRVTAREHQQGTLEGVPATMTLVKGIVDRTPVTVLSISARDRCIRDLVLWSFSEDSQALIDTFGEISASLLWIPGARP